MLFPARGLLDAFNRVGVGPHWSAISAAYNNIDVINSGGGAGTAFNPGTGGLDALALNDFFINTGTSEEAYVTVDVLGLNPPFLPWTIGVGVRAGNNAGNINGIFTMVDLADQMWIVNVGNSVFTAVEGPAFVPFIEGSIIGIQAQGDRITAWVSQPNRGLPGYEVLTHYINNDSFINRGTGNLALGIFDGGAQVRNFGGGNLTGVNPGSPLILPHSVSGSLR